MWNLYIVTLLKVFIRSQSLFVEQSKYRIISSAHNNGLNSSFPFHSSGRAFKHYINKSRKGGSTCLILDFGGNYFSFFPFNIMFITSSYSSYFYFLWGFYYKGMLNFVKGFYNSIEMIILFFILFVCCTLVIGFCMWNHPCIPEMETTC
jgi:hypothetical protein